MVNNRNNVLLELKIISEKIIRQHIIYAKMIHTADRRFS